MSVSDGGTVVLRPATEDDRQDVYAWMARSDITSAMMGPPDFPDSPVPDWEEFCADYLPHYFDGSDPGAGRGFIVMVDGEAVGAVFHNRIDHEARETELDIWLRSLAHCGRGWGSEALDALCAQLHAELGVERFLIRPSARNRRAVRAYERAGFRGGQVSEDEVSERFGPADHADTVTLLRRIDTC